MYNLSAGERVILSMLVQALHPLLPSIPGRAFSYTRGRGRG